MEAELPFNLKNRKKGICLVLRKQKPIGHRMQPHPVLGSSQNDLVFSSMLLVSHQTGVLCRGVSIDNESDQAT